MKEDILRHLSREFLEKQLGCTCINCGSNKEIQYHHIVPIALGGNDILSNIVPLCGVCHHLVHYGENSEYINHSALIKAGMKRARENNIKIGRKLVTYDDIPLNIKNLCNDAINKKISITKAAELGNISRPTIYKYIKIIQEYNNK